MRSILYAVLVASLFMVVLEFCYRYTGGVPSISPGKTHLEFQWKMKNSNESPLIYLVGDSRVDMGFGDRLFTEKFNELHGVKFKAVNAGLPAGSVSDIVTYIVGNHPNDKPGVIVINFTPASFCFFSESPGVPIPNLKMQDFVDHRIKNYLLEILYTNGTGLRMLFRHFQDYMKNGYRKRFAWFSRTLFPEGFIGLSGGYNDGSKMITDISPYQKMFSRIRSKSNYYMKRMDRAYNVIREAKNSGWAVILIRMPIGKKLLELESGLPGGFKAERVAYELSLEYIDYNSDPRTRYVPRGESHLKPAGAREMSGILAHDMSRLLENRKIYSELDNVE